MAYYNFKRVLADYTFMVENLIVSLQKRWDLTQ